MTTKEKLIDMCIQNGMFETQAVPVVEAAIVEIDAKDDYKTTWNRPAEEYPLPLLSISSISCFTLSR